MQVRIIHSDVTQITGNPYRRTPRRNLTLRVERL